MWQSADGGTVDALRVWQQWLIGRSPAVRDQLFFLYCAWAHMLARQVRARYPHPLAEWQDYASYSAVGLLQAIDGYDASVQTRFQSYAEPFVKGAILKGLACYRRDVWSANRHPALGRVDEGHCSSLSGEPGDTVQVAVDLAFGCFLELGIISTLAPGNDPLGCYELEHRHQQLSGLIRRLPTRERAVLIGHYYQHMSFVALARLLCVSKSRVTQLHAQALRRVRVYYQQLGESDGFC